MQQMQPGAVYAAAGLCGKLHLHAGRVSSKSRMVSPSEQHRPLGLGRCLDLTNHAVRNVTPGAALARAELPHARRGILVGAAPSLGDDSAQARNLRRLVSPTDVSFRVVPRVSGTSALEWAALTAREPEGWGAVGDEVRLVALRCVPVAIPCLAAESRKWRGVRVV